MLLAVRISSYERTWEVWRALKKLELLSAAPRATLTHFSWSPNFPRTSITRYTHANHEKILNFLLRLIINKIFVIALVSKRNILINVFLGLSDISTHDYMYCIWRFDETISIRYLEESTDSFLFWWSYPKTFSDKYLTNANAFTVGCAAMALPSTSPLP